MKRHDVTGIAARQQQHRKVSAIRRVAKAKRKPLPT